MSLGLSAGAVSLISAGASIAAPLIGGMMAGDSAGSAYGAQAEGAGQANQTLQANYDQTRGDFSGYMETGGAANNKLSFLLGLGGGTVPDKITQAYRDNLGRDPLPVEVQRWQQYGKEGLSEENILNAIATSPEAIENAGRRQYTPTAGDGSSGSLTRQFNAGDLAKDVTYQNGLQFGLDEGAKGISNMASATGSQLSGATLKALTRFGNDYATTKTAGAADRYSQRQNQIYGMLSGTSNSGQQAAGTVSQAGQAMAGGVAANQIGLGNARGASEIAQGNAWSNGLSGAISGYQTNKLINSLTNRGSSSGALGGYRTGAGTMNELASYGVF